MDAPTQTEIKEKKPKPVITKPILFESAMQTEKTEVSPKVTKQKAVLFETAAQTSKFPEPEIQVKKPILSSCEVQTEAERAKTPPPEPVKPTVVEYWAQTDDVKFAEPD